MPHERSEWMTALAPKRIYKKDLFYGSKAFDGCTKLSKITVNGNTLKTVGGKCLKNTKSGIKIVIKAKKQENR